MHLSIFISVINQLDAQNFCFTISFFLASTCFEHMRSSSGGQNCITQLSQPVHETATYRCDDTRGCLMQFWPPDDEHMCSKHVEAWNKLIVKQKVCASSWLITEINIVQVILEDGTLVEELKCLELHVVTPSHSVPILFNVLLFYFTVVWVN